MKKWINKYFGFTKGEFNGLLVLTGLILIVTLAPYTFNFFWPETNDAGLDAQAIRRLKELNNDSTKKWVKKTWFRENGTKRKQGVLFGFDPNQLNLEGWQKLGFSLKQAKSILRYRESGGQFKKPEDLKKLFVVSSEMYEKLEGYIWIKPGTVDSSGKMKYKRPSYLPAGPVFVEVNGADSAGLEKIKGIGPAFAKRIVKYRDRLGGFYKKEQLMEVFGLDSAKFMEIKEQVNIDPGRLKKLQVNSAGFDEFKHHPYLRYKQINAIIEYRKQHGNYVNIADLKKVAILTPQLIEKLEPYLTF